MESNAVQKFKMKDDVLLHARIAQPKASPKAVAVVLHGAALHGGYYTSFIKLLALHGVLGVAFDRRGHGRSGGERGHADHPMQHADDLVACLDDIRARTGLPLIVIAHSAGAAILLKALPHMKMPLAGIAFIAPTIATDLSLIRQECDEGRVWDLAKFGTRMRYGVETRPSKSVVDPRLGKMKLSFLIFLMSRTFGIPKRMPVLTYTPVSADEEPYVYSAAGAISSMLANKVEYYLGYIGSPVLLATGENDAVVNDAPMHAIFPWGLPLNVPLTALSFPGADHFSTLFHAVRQLPPWIAKCLEVRK